MLNESCLLEVSFLFFKMWMVSVICFISKDFNLFIIIVCLYGIVLFFVGFFFLDIIILVYFFCVI